MLISYLIQLLLKDPIQFVIAFILITLPLLISVTFHEWAHGFVAYKFGDPTPKQQGRLTLNPLVHIDPVGTLMLFIVGIGWAKPVMINPLNIEGRTKQMFVALAGPLSNIFLALVFTGCIYFILLNLPYSSNPLLIMMLYLLNLIVRVNILLALFNLMPIPPLDGSRILAWLLPESLEELYYKLEPYGMFILLLILFTVGFGFVLDQVNVIQQALYNFIGIGDLGING